jgi:hypothetical protein
MSRKKWIGAASIFALLAVVVPAGVAVAHHEDNPAAYTGCLNDNGRFVALKTGSSPRRPCTAEEERIHLSSGDITSIQAGTGLRVPSDPSGFALTDGSGSARLDLAPRYRLPQSCTANQLPAWTGSSWTCAAPAPVTKTYVGTADGPDILGNDWSTVGGMLTLPAGKYSLTAKVTAQQWEAEANVVVASCRLDVTGHAGIDYATVYIGEGHDYAPTGVLTMMSAINRGQEFNVAVACRDSDVGNSRWYNLRIVATSVDEVTHVTL